MLWTWHRPWCGHCKHHVFLTQDGFASRWFLSISFSLRMDRSIPYPTSAYFLVWTVPNRVRSWERWSIFKGLKWRGRKPGRSRSRFSSLLASFMEPKRAKFIFSFWLSAHNREYSKNFLKHVLQWISISSMRRSLPFLSDAITTFQYHDNVYHGLIWCSSLCSTLQTQRIELIMRAVHHLDGAIFMVTTCNSVAEHCFRGK